MKKRVFNLYLDDSGTRHPTRRQGKRPKHGHDWFALGGVLIDECEEECARQLHANFCSRWNIAAPLHSSEIRSKNEGFAWLRARPKEEQDRFYEELYGLMRDCPVLGLACVVDRPGYNSRYLDLYNQQPWSLCKTAFNIVVERAAKFAKSRGAVLRVHPERCNKQEDRFLKAYYDELRLQGMPFDTSNSSKYAPLPSDELAKVLYDFKTKNKSSPLAQLADLYLWPMCIGGYDKENRPFQRLLGDEKFVDCHIPSSEIHTLGTKYSCFDLER